jgi:hypothetical protein
MNMSNLGYPARSCIHARFRKATPDSPYLCGAGVNMEVWRDLRYEQMPCFLDKNGHSQPDAAHCAHLRRPTLEEIAAYEQWLKQNDKDMETVSAGIADWREAHQGQSVSEVVECPACKGRLHLSIFYNGHAHGHCETEGCVEWVE